MQEPTGPERSASPEPAPGPFGPVEVTEHLWIPMPDGIRLAARLWLPRAAHEAPVPALLEAIPYRKSDLVRARDERNHPYFAAHGYACLRIDMRGSGDSEGLMTDMYGEAELSDVREAIEWIASRPWCSGRVGMFGTSWGGTAALQANVDAPEALRAVIAVCATHDRYEDDIHHMGGCLLGDTFEWGATLPAILGAPPTANAGADWLELWRERIRGAGFPLEAWVRERARGAYWRRGSVIRQADRLARPILAVGGWTDRYSSSVTALLSARPDLVWGVVGPWGHQYPDQGRPGPAIGFQQLALEWWNRWLSDPPEPPDWPRLRTWLREFEPPADAVDRRNGRWIQSGPPMRHTRPTGWHAGGEGLTATAPAGGGWDVPADLRVGVAGGDTGYFGRHGGLPLDQAEDDALSLNFDTRPLEADCIVFGRAELRLRVAAASPLRQLSLRLNHAAPDGTSARVVLAMRNLALDDDFDAPAEPFGAGPRSVRVAFPPTAYRFRRGHRIRLSIASSYWPTVWPSPGTGGVRLLYAYLSLPVFEGVPEPLARPFPEPLKLPPVPSYETVCAPPLERFSRVESDGARRSGWRQPYTEVFHRDVETAYGFETRGEYRIVPDDPLSASCRFDHRAAYRRPDGTARLRCTVRARSTAEAHELSGRLRAEWNGEPFGERDWFQAIPRRHG